MGAVAAVLVVVGIIALIYSIMERAKAGRVNKTPFVKTGQAGATSGDVSVEGNVVCQQPLVAPFSGAPCLYYSIKCTAEWKEGDKNKSKEISSDKVAARFSIDDGSGPVAVDAAKGGSFEPKQTKLETKGTGLMGGITGKELMFGQYAVSTGALSLGTKYKVEEEILPMQSRLYVNGASQGGAITTPGMLRSLIITNKTREALLDSALKGAKLAMMIGIAGLVVGGGLGAASKLMAPSNDSAAATNPAGAATPEVAAAPAAPAATPAALDPAAAEPAVPAMKMEDLKAASTAKKTGTSAPGATATGGATTSTAKATAAAASGATPAPTAAAPGATKASTAPAPKAAASSPASAPKAGGASKAKPASSK